MRIHVVERFVADSAGECGVARHHDDILVTTAQVTSDCHTKSSGKRRPSVASAVAIVLAFRAQKKTVETAVLPHRVKTIEASGKHFMHVTLVTHIHDEAVTRRVEYAMQGNRQFDDAEIRSEMAPCLGKNLDQLIAYLLCKLRQVLFAQRFDIHRRTDPFEQTRGRGCRLGSLRRV